VSRLTPGPALELGPTLARLALAAKAAALGLLDWGDTRLRRPLARYCAAAAAEPCSRLKFPVIYGAFMGQIGKKCHVKELVLLGNFFYIFSAQPTGSKRSFSGRPWFGGNNGFYSPLLCSAVQLIVVCTSSVV
jgi:hypothetical protein